MGMKKICLRYHPPGIILEYTRKGKMKSKEIDLLDLSISENPDLRAAQVIENEPLLATSKSSSSIIKGRNVSYWRIFESNSLTNHSSIFFFSTVVY